LSSNIELETNKQVREKEYSLRSPSNRSLGKIPSVPFDLNFFNINVTFVNTNLGCFGKYYRSYCCKYERIYPVRVVYDYACKTAAFDRQG
jgi:hypothetical protein